MPGTHPLEKYRYKNRLLLIFAPSPQDPRYLEQRLLLRGSEAAIDERELLVHDFFGDEVSAAVWKLFKIASGTFAVVLVGKDGGEKARFMEPVNSVDLYTLINQMPMRQHEIRRQLR